MRLRDLILIAAVSLPLGLPAVASAETKAPKSPTPVVKTLPPVGDYPDADCNTDNSPGIYIGPTGMLWECICEERQFVKPDPDDCHWYDQGLITPPESRKLKAKLHRSTVPRGRVIDTKHWRLMPV